jgi:hypothetical protein
MAPSGTRSSGRRRTPAFSADAGVIFIRYVRGRPNWVLQEIFQPSGAVPTMAAMFRALLICSDDDCTDSFEAYGTLEELHALACECGCGLEIISLENAEEADARLVLAPLS